MPYSDYYKKKNLDLGNGLTVQATYDKNGKLVRSNGVATPAVSGWQNTQPIEQTYGDRLNKGLNTLDRIAKYKDPYADDVRSAYGDVKNFFYDANSDPDYQNYLGSLERQSQSAQKQTMSNLSSMTGGRNNSWASAAVGQVGQAFTKKGADAQADFADRAYQRLLQRYNLVGQMSDRGFNQNEAMFNRQNNMVNTYNQLEQQAYNNSWNDKIQGQAYDVNQYNFGLDKQYAPRERAYQAEINRQAVAKGEIDLNAYPTLVQQQILSGDLSIEGAKIQNALGQKEYDWYDRNAQANIAAVGRSNRSKPTQYEQQQGVKRQISQLLYPSNLPQSISALYYPVQQLSQNRGTLNSYAGKAFVDSLIQSEVAKVANAEGLSYQEALSKYGFEDLVKY